MYVVCNGHAGTTYLYLRLVTFLKFYTNVMHIDYWPAPRQLACWVSSAYLRWPRSAVGKLTSAQSIFPTALKYHRT